jgi:hypothetical protein
MTPRLSHLLAVALAVITIVAGALVLRYLPSAPLRAVVTAERAPEPAPLIGAPSGPHGESVSGAIIPGLRGRVGPESPRPSEPPVADSPPPAAEAPSPAAEAPPLVAEAAPQVEASVEAVEKPAPLPPARPGDLAPPPLLHTPLPPARPSDLAALEAPPLQEPLPTAPQVDVPLPPSRPRGLASAPSEPAVEASPAPPAAAPPQQQVARAPEPVLRPAPQEAFTPPEAPARFGMGDPVYVRIFKQEGQLELWLKRNGRFHLYHTYPICKWSGHLGPKLKEADYQSPEGFYSVSARQLHPHSNYQRAFNVGYPNAFDRQNGRTGGLVMVHGNCKSVGCFAMTDSGIEEIYGFVDAALRAGQREIPVHIFPFRMTESAIAHETGAGGGFSSLFGGGGGSAQWAGFWHNLKEGYDIFEQTGEPPTAYACGDRYSFGAAGASCSRIAGW